MADELERQRARLQEAGAALREHHASALAMLAESSSVSAEKRRTTAAASAAVKLQEPAPSDQEKAEEARNAAELERVRVKLEEARAKMSGPFSEIPTGREYDSPPDPSEEQVYDALEKAYNAAFVAPPASSGEATRVEHTDSVFRQDEAQRSVFGQAADPPTTKVIEKASPAKKDAKVDERAGHVGTLKSLCLSTLKEHAEGLGQELRSDNAVQGSNMGPECTPSASSFGPASGGQGDVKPRGGQELEVAEILAPASAESITTTGSAPQSPGTVPGLTMQMDSDVDMQSPRSNLTTLESGNSEDAIVERADHLSLNDFLVSELQMYCSRLFDQPAPKRGASGVSDLAQFTAFQLYQDHQRSLMDFDDEWKRSHADSYRGFAEDTPVGAPQGSITCNPFQQNSTGMGSAEEWETLANGVKASSTNYQAWTNAPLNWSSQDRCRDLLAAYKRGSNGIVIGRDNGHSERVQIGEYMGQLCSTQNTPAFHMVIAGSADLAEWECALSSSKLTKLYPYWGDKNDRQNLLQLLSNEYFSSRVSAHVLLTSYEVFMEDLSVLTSLQCQISVIDVPGPADQIPKLWPQLLSGRCRQRLLICPPTYEMDARKLLHFVVPELFGSRRKLLAWNCAAFNDGQIRALCDLAKEFIIDSDPKRFVEKLESRTRENSKREKDALDKLDMRAGESSIKVPLKRLLHGKPFDRARGHISVKGKLLSQKLFAERLDPHLSIQAPTNLPKKRRGGGNKRIRRCGKCAGCLAEDCMKCDHCQDMKKYGGPGLRKQSCRNRKCLNPKMRGDASKKRRRRRVDEDAAAGDADSATYESEAYSSVESDRDSVSTGTYGFGSDSESLPYSDATIDSPRDLLLPASDTRLDAMSRSARSRVMRCGKCAGCTAPDCMKCLYCLDMKKHGGPGLRKQSCKDRKCIAPKIVVLNQSKGGQYEDEHGNVVFSGDHTGDSFPGFYEAPDSTETDKPGKPTEVLSVIQECERFVEPQLTFVCTLCTTRFSSKLLLEFHVRLEHAQATYESAVALTKFEQEASKLLMHPIYQNAILCAEPKQQHDRGSPLGYAKLEGHGFQYFLLEPFVVLGRMNLGWRKLYQELGFQGLQGLAAGDVGCHVGNDSMIANTHAVISWDAHQGSFVIECLSARSSISVDGQEVSFSSSPVVLRSRNLVQIGASVFHFLLPKTTEAVASRDSTESRAGVAPVSTVMRITTQQLTESSKRA